jgi:hypothetical protein
MHRWLPESQNKLPEGSYEKTTKKQPYIVKKTLAKSTDLIYRTIKQNIYLVTLSP